ncbi:hypothetical protein [Streptomyces glaucus]|uniref:Uncharacterized protein n=1 Tax=Streptomyces glaucus TaxID=284029 RepID=A0ABN3JVR5_9ACTN
MTPDAALGHLITVLAGQLTTNPVPVAFWMPTAGDRAGAVIWGDPNRRTSYRPGDDPAEWEFRELVMGWPEFVNLIRGGLAPAQVNTAIQARAARYRARYGL